MAGAILQWTGLGIIVVALFFGAAFLASRYYFSERPPDEIHFTRTGDGWLIATARYRPANAIPGAPPVVLLPGIGMNAVAFDLDDGASLARFLAAAGYDVWAVDLRGRGASSQPRLFSRFSYDWSFDEYVDQDVPAALDAVRRATGVAQVQLVGYSLGGLVSYAYLGGDAVRRNDVRAAVVVGAPATFAFQRRYLRFWPLRKLRWLRHQQLMRVLAPLAGYWQPTTVQLVHNPANMSGEVLRRAMVNVSVSFARDELLQLSDWIDHDVFRSIDQRRDYRKDLARITVPMLFVTGNRDLLAPPNAMKAAYDAVGSADKTLLVASRGQGHEANYGHLDLMMGEQVQVDIFPAIRDFLDAHAGVEVDRAGRDGTNREERAAS